MNVVVFDIDGVLNGDKDPPESPAIMPEKIQLLNQLVDNDVVFVLSSSWRGEHSFYEMKSGLKEIGFEGRLIDFTTHMWEDLNGKPLRRADQILLWINTHKDDIDNYVVIDDWDLKNVDIESNFVRVIDSGGLTQGDVDKAKNILNAK